MAAEPSEVAAPELAKQARGADPVITAACGKPFVPVVRRTVFLRCRKGVGDKVRAEKSKQVERG